MNAAAIVTRGLTRRFGDLVAVDHIDLNIPQAQIYGFLGPNGSGKSTTIRMLCGLLIPSEGEAEVLGLRVPGEAEALKHKIGYMTQRFSLYEDLSALGGESLWAKDGDRIINVDQLLREDRVDGVYVFVLDSERRLERGLAACDEIDAALAAVRAVRPPQVLRALATGESLEIPGTARGAVIRR